MTLAIRGGLIFLLISIAIGFAISIYGNHQVNVGKDPGVYGNGGVTKFPHGVAIHSIQLFPFLSFVLRKLGFDETERFRFLKNTVGAMALFFVFSLWQTLSGYARFTPNVIGATVMLCAGLCMAKAVLDLMKSWKQQKNRASSAGSL